MFRAIQNKLLINSLILWIICLNVAEEKSRIVREGLRDASSIEELARKSAI